MVAKKKTDPVADLVEANLKLISAASAPSAGAKIGELKPISETGAFTFFYIPLSQIPLDTASSSLSISVTGYGAVLSQYGSPGVPLRVRFGNSEARALVGGCALRSDQKFTRLELNISSLNGAQAGYSASPFTEFALLVIEKIPTLRYEEQPSPSRGGQFLQDIHNAAYNVTTDTPPAATSGVLVEGASVVKIEAISGNGLFTGGSIKLHWYSPNDNWDESDVELVLPTTRANACFEVPVMCPKGRIFAEGRSITNAGGSGVTPITIYSWGK